MKNFPATIAVIGLASALSLPVHAAGNDMSKMNVPMNASTPKKASDTDQALANAEVIKVDAATSMITLKHEKLANIGMPAMTMAYKTKDASILGMAHQGDKVKVRVENIDGMPTIVTLVK